jgi:hypothetical protein
VRIGVSERFNPALTVFPWNWIVAFVSLRLTQNESKKKRYEVSFSETTDKNRKTIYGKDGNVHHQRGLYSKNLFELSL